MSIPIKTLTLPISSGGSTTETEYSFITPDDMDKKADNDGYYEEMTVGDAEQLVATQYVSDSEPYLFRTTGGSADVGNREYKKSIVGGTLAWNQIYQTHTSFSTTADLSGLTINVANGFIDVTGSTANEGRIQVLPVTRAIPANHVCLMLCDGWNGFSWRRNGFAPVEKDYFMNRHSVDWDAFAAISVRANTTYNIHARFSSYDLTQMFGSTIADYIYSLEQATAGAGVAWFKKLFPKDYYEYDAGSLKHVEGLSEHVTVGFNQWDEEWEVGTIGNTGQNYTSDDRIRSKNYIPVFPNTTYYLTIGDGSYYMYLWGYDADKNYVGRVPDSQLQRGTVTIPSWCNYLRFAVHPNYGTTYKNDICINLSWSGYRNGEYEPYEKHSYPLDDSLVLRGIPKLDSSNNLYFDGDVYEADGSVERKYGIVDLGTLTWKYNATYGMYTDSLFTIIKKFPKAQLANILCEKYITASWNSVFSGGTNSGLIGVTDSGLLGVSTAETDTTAFKTAMSGVYLVYELATPTTEEAEPYNEVQICDDFGTEEFVSTSIVPVGHVTEYPANLRDKLQHLPDLADSDGVFAILQSNKQMSLTTIPTAVAELPEAPTEDGSYVLKATVSNGAVTYAWEAE